MMIFAISNKIIKNVIMIERTANAIAEMSVVPVVISALIAVMIESVKFKI